MPIYAVWMDDAKTVIRQVFEGNWTLEEFLLSNQALRAEVERVGHTVHIICDLRESRSVPSNLLSAARQTEKQLAPNVGLIVILNSGMLISTLIRIASGLMPRFQEKIRYADSLEAALNLTQPSPKADTVSRRQIY
jgi:hypothetical protein